MTLSGADDRQGWFDWYVEWAGHHNYIYWFWLMVSPITRLLGEFDLWVSPFIFLWAFVTMIIGFRHDRKTFCLRCIREAPLDPQKEITRYDRRLRVIHGVTKKRFALGALAWISLGFSSSLFLGWISPGNDLPPLWLVILVNIMVWGPVVYLNICGQWHQWLHPWCPYCRRWDDGGAPEVVPDPVPSGEGDKVS
jgi:hypothetical protein